MTAIAEPSPVVTGGVDTHLGIHVAAVLTAVGGGFRTGAFPTTAAGCRRLLAWMLSLGQLDQVGSKEPAPTLCRWLGTCIRRASRSSR